MTTQPIDGAYPKHMESDVVLRDGSTVRVRPVRPDDEAPLLAFYRTMSQQDREARFFARTSDDFLTRYVREMTDVDYERRLGLIATTGEPGRIVAHAMYAASTGTRAEVAFAVSQEYQGRGLGTLLLGQLAGVAAAHGITLFEADVMAYNLKMLQVFRDAGFPTQTRAEAGEIHEEFPTELTPQALSRFEDRERVAAVNALQAFFTPRAIAVIGASRQRGTISGELFHNLISFGFPGPIYPINLKAPDVQGVRAYPTVEDAPGPVDLAFIAVPAEHVIPAVEACGRKGVRAVVVISAGFAETDDRGRDRQAALLKACRAAGMRLIGPNCMGILNTHPDVRLNGTFVPTTPNPGRVGFSSQSGALGLAVIDYARSLGLGLSTFVSVGNKADISGNDLLSYWESDPNTDVILLYLESFGNPRRFSRIARRVGRSKPIIAVKSGRSRAGARATSSHTGAMIAASDITVDALFTQSGVIRTDTLEGMFAVATLLANQPLPAGRRVGILTNAGGPGILCADSCEAEGLEIPLLDGATQQRLRAFLPGEASVVNPVDMIASASAEQYRDAIVTMVDDPNLDALVVIFIPPLLTKPEDVARAIAEAVRAVARKKPVLAVFMSSKGVPEELRVPEARVPSYAFPESAAIALARVTRYAEWLQRPVPDLAQIDREQRAQAARILRGALQRGAEWLAPDDVAALLACYGLPYIEQRVVPTPDDAGAAAEALGGQVVLKAIAPGLIHRSDVGAVRLRLQGADAVRTTAVEMAARLAGMGAAPTGFVVQRMAAPGVEMLAGVVHDRQFGPVVACGAGGVLVELLGDVRVRLAPLTRDDAAEMLRSLKTYPLLTGYRGQPPRDVEALLDIIVRTSLLADDLPEIAEMDCNPILVHERGATIVDARIRVARVEPPLPLGARR